MRMRRSLFRWSVRLLTLALFAGVCWSFCRTQRAETPVAVKQKSKPRRAEEELCAGLVLSQLSGGGDLLSAERIFTRRMRRGPIRLPIREMVIDRLNLALPESYFRPALPPEPNAAPAAASGRFTRPKTVSAAFDALKKDDEHLRKLLPTVAGLRIRGLRISRIEDGTNVVPWVCAERGKAEQGGLALSGGWSVEKGVTNFWEEAYLVGDPALRLLTEGGR